MNISNKRKRKYKEALPFDVGGVYQDLAGREWRAIDEYILEDLYSNYRALKTFNDYTKYIKIYSAH